MLWLEGNGISKIEGLENQVQLRTLYLQENVIEHIEGLNSLSLLDTLDLSKNCIKCVENLSCLPNLTTLSLGYNQLCHFEDVKQLESCQKLQTLDLQSNRVADPRIVDVIAALPGLRVLYLQGNPIVKSIPHYRKIIVSRCRALRYLDDRPIFEEERKRCNVWAHAMAEGGLTAAQVFSCQHICHYYSLFQPKAILLHRKLKDVKLIRLARKRRKKINCKEKHFRA